MLCTASILFAPTSFNSKENSDNSLNINKYNETGSCYTRSCLNPLPLLFLFTQILYHITNTFINKFITFFDQYSLLSPLFHHHINPIESLGSAMFQYNICPFHSFLPAYYFSFLFYRMKNYKSR